jgi:hypothetical protein
MKGNVVSKIMVRGKLMVNIIINIPINISISETSITTVNVNIDLKDSVSLSTLESNCPTGFSSKNLWGILVRRVKMSILIPVMIFCPIISRFTL